MQPVKGEERVLGFCCLFSPLLDPAAASEEQSGFEMRNTQGLTLGLEGLWGDVMLFLLRLGIFSRGCDAPECCETICNLLQEEKIARARVPRSAQVDLLSGCAEV